MDPPYPAADEASMYWINTITERKLGGIDRLRPTICDILTTPLGWRVMRNL